MPFPYLIFGLGLGILLQKYFPVGTLPGVLGTQLEKMESQLNRLFKTGPYNLQSGIPPEFQGQLSLIILAGQSNMSGADKVPKSSQNTNLRVFVFGNNYRWRIAREPIDDPKGQVDKVFEDLKAGYSPGTAFADSLVSRNQHMVIGLIPCVKWGSSIHEWQRNLSENSLYGSCLKRVRAASTMGKVAGLLFFQGESDALDPRKYPKKKLSPNNWSDKFVSFANDLRRDLSELNLPVVFAQIGNHRDLDKLINWKIVQDQQKNVKLPNSAMITTSDLALKDHVHLTAESSQIIGERFASAFWDLIQGQINE